MASGFLMRTAKDRAEVSSVRVACIMSVCSAVLHRPQNGTRVGLSLYRIAKRRNEAAEVRQAALDGISCLIVLESGLNLELQRFKRVSVPWLRRLQQDITVEEETRIKAAYILEVLRIQANRLE
jgi:hypothetical protein